MTGYDGLKYALAGGALMCGRFTLVPGPQTWADHAGTLGEELCARLAGLPPRTDLRPTMPVPVVYQPAAGAALELQEMRWGLIPPWWTQARPPPSTFNCRLDRALESGMWRTAFLRTRALIPATAWIEWQKQLDRETGEILTDPKTRRPKTLPHRLSVAGDRGFFFAGLYARNQRQTPGQVCQSCTIITTEPVSPELAAVHERMPLVLKPEVLRRWLDPAASDPAQIMALIRQGQVRDYTIRPARGS